MINNANKYLLSEIFAPDNKTKYIIPKFQREYIWNKDNWEELLNDVLESDGNHFIGSIICINKGTDTFNPELELIDGQQRLTTVSLVFSVIYQLLKDKIKDNDDELKSELTNLKWSLILKHNKNLRIELSYQNNNHQDYQAVLSEIGVIDFSDTSLKNIGNRRIYKAYKYFLNKLENFSEKELFGLLEKIKATMIVKIEVSSHSDAFLLFESLNNRGVPLSAIDLIKNKMLSELEKKAGLTIDESFTKWNKIINALPEYTIQERFIRQFYNAFKSSADIKVGNYSKATRSNIIKIYETLIAKNPTYIFDQLIQKSSIYNELVFPDDLELEPYISIKAELIDLSNVQAAPAYAFLLFLFSNYKGQEISFYKEIIRLLVKYFIRRNITDFPNTRNLDQIFIDIVEELHNDKEKVNIKYLVEYFTNNERFSPKDKFEEYLNGDLYEMNVEATRFILSKIEEVKRQTKEINPNFWQKDRSNKLIWSIEHVFPEGKNIPKYWLEMIADGDREKAEALQEKYVHKLGNLTLTIYNQSLSNFEFIKKRDRKDSKGKNIGYKNQLFLNNVLAIKDEWKINDIENRTKELVSIALEIFDIDRK
ncbi:DUF262 domain-containing protein [Patescibacteria group bacterium]|nr:MAG: DUF262 domain-containing protein [Patescibacteria group bacterium]